VVKIAAYGTWESPISSDDVAAAGSSPQWVDLVDGRAWWTEGQPAEGGRVALFRDTANGPQEVVAAPWNVRNRVHEYGGRPWVAFATPEGTRIAFTNWGDQRVYVLDPDTPGSKPTPISPEPPRPNGYRYSDLVAGPGREVWCVRETVTGDRPIDVERDLVALPIDGDGDQVRTLATSHHFLAAPRPSPDGRHLAWLGWNHPAMPWDGTELLVAPLTEQGVAGEHRVIAGGPREAVCQIEWADAESLYAMTDPHGWWNLHRVGLDGSARNLAPVEADLGGPMWVLGSRWFAPLGKGRHAVLHRGKLSVLDETSGTIAEIDGLGDEWTAWASHLAVDGSTVCSVAAGPKKDAAVLSVDVDTSTLVELTAQPASLPDPSYLSAPQLREFTAGDGERIPAFVYPPHNPEFAAPEGELPPFLVHVHGGPTGSASPTVQPSLAYFTSRGIGVVVVNYGGSTGYGRAFRERLRENWGLIDVTDCAAVAEALAAEGTADPDRLAVRGGSAGGWTTAASLTSVSTYRCGTSMFPVLDLEGWTDQGGETHDFESQYVTSLVGPYPETADRYRERSPLHNVGRLAGPILFLQGLEDEICPPAQAERFVAALEGTGIEHGYIAFEGEQHGFRRAESIRTAVEAELAFYGQVMGFEPVGVPKVELRS
jgi:dipeptidyl aminopeptidase/acylaminoacyl peptidase